MKIPKRDLLWSTFIHRQYINNGIVFNYINWAQNVKGDTNSREQIFLAGHKPMCWFFDFISQNNSRLMLLQH